MKISFIIPCFNCRKTISEAIDSIFNIGLDSDNFEICLVDDGSDDGTYNLLKKYKKKYSNNIKIGRNEKNIGAGETRNGCFLMSSFDYIFMLDADNIIERESFKKIIRQADFTEDVIAFGSIKFFYPIFFNKIKILYKEFFFLKERMFFFDIRKTVNTPAMDGNYLFRREVFEKVGGYEKSHGVDTWGFGYKILNMGYSFKIVKGAFYFHRVNRNSYWFRNINSNFEQWRNFLLKYKKGLSSDEIIRLANGEDVVGVVISEKNDFMIEKTSSFFKILLKIYYVFWRIPKER